MITGPIQVSSSLVVIRTQLRVGGTNSGATNLLRGTLDIANYSSDSLFISLIPQYWGEESTTTLVSPKGTFLLSGFNYGQFILTISDANRTLCSQLVDLAGEKLATGVVAKDGCSIQIKNP